MYVTINCDIEKNPYLMGHLEALSLHYPGLTEDYDINTASES